MDHIKNEEFYELFFLDRVDVVYAYDDGYDDKYK
jgi:hypothetical protein